MKYLLLLLSFFTFAQQDIEVKFDKTLSDPKKRTRSITVLDIRPSSDLGTVTVKDKVYRYWHEKDVKAILEEKFLEGNKGNEGVNDILVLIEKLNVSVDSSNVANYNLNIKVATFYKRANYYSLISKIDGVFPNNINNRLGPANALADKIDGLLMSTIVNSYGSVAINYPLQHSDILNYEKIISESFPINKLETKVNGVYTDLASFLKQTPSNNYSIRTNKKGEFVGIKEGQLNASSSEVYAVIHDNVIHKSTLVGFKQVFEDEQGRFMNTSYHKMFKIKSGNTGAMVGGMMGGLVGGVIGGLVDVAASGPSVVYGDLLTSKVYLDSITFGYTLK